MAEQPTTNALNVQEKAHMSGGMGRRPVTITRGTGATLIDNDGNEYTDLSGGNGWACLGHGHPEITRAIQAQAARLVAYTEAGFNDQRALWFAELASLLAETIGEDERGPLSFIHPCNSGTEAVESALKAARFFTGREGIVAAKGGFHGRTLGALSATWKPVYRKPFLPLVPGFTHIAFNNCDELEQAITGETAALILEVIQGEGGVRPATAQFLARAESLCKARGALLIIDEVQTGFGRTGAWFASSPLDCHPDMLTLGKAIGGGIPMGAVAWRKSLGPLTGGLHASTFGGNPLACAAGRAVIKVLRNEGLPERAATLGSKIQNRLAAAELPTVREIRGAGFMIGLELKVKVQPIIKELMQRRIWALPAGPNVLRLLPPLVISEELLDQAVTDIIEVLRG